MSPHRNDVLSETMITGFGSLLLVEVVHVLQEEVDWDAMANREGGRSSRSIVDTTAYGSGSNVNPF
jgi:hypothetical protein